MLLWNEEDQSSTTYQEKKTNNGKCNISKDGLHRNNDDRIAIIDSVKFGEDRNPALDLNLHERRWFLITPKPRADGRRDGDIKITAPTERAHLMWEKVRYHWLSLLLIVSH